MPKINEQILKLFNDNKIKLIKSDYLPKGVIESIHAYLSAIYFLSNNRDAVLQGEDDISRDFLSKFCTDSLALTIPNEILESIITCNEIVILSTYQSGIHECCEFQINFTSDKKSLSINMHAKLIYQDGQYHLAEILHPFIRIIGDPVLQQQGVKFPDHPTDSEINELNNQIRIAKEILIVTGGAGIAANQCANIKLPYQFTIVGVYNNDKIHAGNVAARYPGVKFPEATLMINPKIESSSEELTSFTHGCLSVPGRIRGEIKTPTEITVTYKTLNQNGMIEMNTLTANGTDAVVLQHELNHILFGKTYVDRCLSALPISDVNILEEMLSIEEVKRTNQPKVPADINSKGEFYRFVSIQNDGGSKLDTSALASALNIGINTSTLFGLKKQISAFRKAGSIDSKPLDCDKSVKEAKSESKKMY